MKLEDDIVAKEDYYQQMKTYVTQEASKPWLYLEFSQLGFIGVFTWYQGSKLTSCFDASPLSLSQGSCFGLVTCL